MRRSTSTAHLPPNLGIGARAKESQAIISYEPSAIALTEGEVHPTGQVVVLPRATSRGALSLFTLTTKSPGPYSCLGMVEVAIEAKGGGGLTVPLFGR